MGNTLSTQNEECEDNVEVVKDKEVEKEKEKEKEKDKEKEKEDGIIKTGKSRHRRRRKSNTYRKKRSFVDVVPLPF